MLLSGPHTPSSRVPPLQDDEGYVGGWILRIRLRLRAELQGGELLRGEKVFRFEKPNKRESSTLRFFIDSLSTDFV